MTTTPATTSAPNEGTSSSSSNYPQWETDLLQAWGAPVSDANLSALALWAQSEGTTGSNNPLAVSGQFPGATKCIAQCGGSSPIFAYGTEAEGVAAMASFTKGSNSKNIVSTFVADAGLTAIFAAINQSGWCKGCQSGKYPVDLYQAVSATPQLGQDLQAAAKAWVNASGAGAAVTAAEGAASAAASVVSWTSSLGNILSWLGSSANWLRIGEFMLGLGLVVGGLVLFIATSKPGQEAISTGAQVAPLLAA